MKTITIEGLKKDYKSGKKVVHALTGVDLEFGEGMFGLLGPNGAGKTTLMRILAGIVRPTSGKVSVYGLGLGSERERIAIKAMLGYLPQELGVYPDLSARQFVDYMAILKGLADSASRGKRVEEVLNMVGLRDDMDRKLKGYSGGMKRRAGIAQALVNDPKLLIVDEPTAGLDPEERIRFRNLLVGLASDRVVILSTHIVEDIGQTSRNMAVLAAGQVIYTGSPSDLTQAAQGKVWTVTMDGPRKPDNGLTVVSMLHMADGVQYRLVGEDVTSYPGAQVTSPGLEDAYVWLMKQTGHAIDSNGIGEKE
jgi:ABC-type multidrug transport system ATPase subunit